MPGRTAAPQNNEAGGAESSEDGEDVRAESPRERCVSDKPSRSAKLSNSAARNRCLSENPRGRPEIADLKLLAKTENPAEGALRGEGQRGRSEGEALRSRGDRKRAPGKAEGRLREDSESKDAARPAPRSSSSHRQSVKDAGRSGSSRDRCFSDRPRRSAKEPNSATRKRWLSDKPRQRPEIVDLKLTAKTETPPGGVKASKHTSQENGPKANAKSPHHIPANEIDDGNNGKIKLTSLSRAPKLEPDQPCTEMKEAVVSAAESDAKETEAGQAGPEAKESTTDPAVFPATGMEASGQQGPAARPLEGAAPSPAPAPSFAPTAAAADHWGDPYYEATLEERPPRASLRSAQEGGGDRAAAAAAAAAPPAPGGGGGAGGGAAAGGDAGPGGGGGAPGSGGGGVPGRPPRDDAGGGWDRAPAPALPLGTIQEKMMMKKKLDKERGKEASTKEQEIRQETKHVPLLRYSAGNEVFARSSRWQGEWISGKIINEVADNLYSVQIEDQEVVLSPSNLKMVNGSASAPPPQWGTLGGTWGTGTWGGGGGGGGTFRTTRGGGGAAGGRWGPAAASARSGGGGGGRLAETAGAEFQIIRMGDRVRACAGGGAAAAAAPGRLGHVVGISKGFYDIKFDGESAVDKNVPAEHCESLLFFEERLDKDGKISTPYLERWAAKVLVLAQREQRQSLYAFLARRAVSERLTTYRGLGQALAALGVERDEDLLEALGEKLDNGNGLLDYVKFVHYCNVCTKNVFERAELFEGKKMRGSIFAQAMPAEYVEAKVNALREKFVVQLSEFCKQHNTTGIKAMFRVFDQDDSGSVDMEEFLEVVQKLHIFSDEDAVALFKSIDSNATGVLEFDEFVHLMFEVEQTRREHSRAEEEKAKHYLVPLSLGALDPGHALRRAALAAARHPGFEAFLTGAIVANTAVLALCDYRYVDAENNLVADGSLRNSVLISTEPLFSGIFLMECLIKVIAFGFCKGKNTYLTDSWNRFDFIIVVASLVSMFDIGVNVSFLRAFRVLRPLRTVAKFPGLRKIIDGVAQSMRSMGNLLVFVVFVYAVAVLLALQFLPGALTRRCRLTPHPVRLDPACTSVSDACWAGYLANVTAAPAAHRCLAAPNDNASWTRAGSPWHTAQDCIWPLYEEHTRLCPPDGLSLASGYCPPGTYCGSDYDSVGNARFFWDTTIPFGVDRMKYSTYNEDLNWGITNFNHFGIALVTIFQISTMEGWVDIAYQGMDAYNAPAVALMMVFFVFLSSFVLMNVMLSILSGFIALESLKEKDAKEVKKRFRLFDASNTAVMPLQQPSGKDHLTTNTDLSEQRSRKNSLARQVQESAAIRVRGIRSGFSRLRPLLRQVSGKPRFEALVMVLILINFFVLAIDRVGISRREAAAHKVISDFLAWAFVVEMLVLLVGHGPIKYLGQPTWVFDGLVTIAGLVDFFSSAGTGLAVLRCVRLLRILKLANKWRDLKVIMKGMVVTVLEMGNFGILMLLFIYIFALLGMTLFANRLCFDAATGARLAAADLSSHKEAECSRPNFDRLLWACVAVFQVITGEGWNSMMYDGQRGAGVVAYFYYIVVVLLGSFILLNIFLAVLLSNLQTTPEEGTGQEPQEHAAARLLRSTSALLRSTSVRLKLGSGRGLAQVAASSDSMGSEAGLLAKKPPPLRKGATKEVLFASSGRPDSPERLHCRRSASKKELSALQEQPSVSGSRSRSSDPAPASGAEPAAAADAAVGASRLKGGAGPGGGAPPLRLTGGAVVRGAATARAAKTLAARRGSAEARARGHWGKLASQGSRIALLQGDGGDGGALEGEGGGGGGGQGGRARRSPTPGEQGVGTAPLLEDLLADTRSCFVFERSNPLRMRATALVSKAWFDWAILACIMASSITLVLDSPLNNPDSTLSKTISVLDVVFTLVFAAEAALKALSLGVAGHRGAYLRDPWNGLDFTIVFFALLDLAPVGAAESSALRVVRVLRVLRPLRLVHRLPELKKVVGVALRSVPAMARASAMVLVFFLLYATAGVAYFKGGFWACQGDAFDALPPPQVELLTDPVSWGSMSQEQLGWFAGTPYQDMHLSWPNQVPTSKALCECWLGEGGWSRVVDQSFDHALAGMGLLFEISTTEGWVDVMLAAADFRGPERQPVENANEGVGVAFFIFFMFFGCFLVMNIFVGIILDCFESESQAIKEMMNMDQSVQEVLFKAQLQRIKPSAVYQPPEPSWRKRCFLVAEHPRFESLTSACIFANAVIMGVQHFGQPDWVTFLTNILNYTFCLYFNIEAIIKLVAYGKSYFNEAWNRFDILIVIGSDLGYIVSWTSSMAFGPIVSVIRLFRLCRLFRLINIFDGLQKFFTKIISTIPKIGNILILLLIIYFIFAVMGMQLFSKYASNDNYNDQANFRSFPLAMLTLYRFTTGEDWNGFMWSMTERPEGCAADPAWDPAWCELRAGAAADPLSGCTPIDGCGSEVAPVVFMYAFTLLIYFTLLNLSLAVVMESMQDQAKEESMIQDVELDDLCKVWITIDPDARLKISHPQLIKFLTEYQGALGLRKVYGARKTTSSATIETLIGSFLEHGAGTELKATGGGFLNWLKTRCCRQRQKTKYYHYQEVAMALFREIIAQGDPDRERHESERNLIEREKEAMISTLMTCRKLKLADLVQQHVSPKV